jgi:hypothetical protein
MNLLLQDYKWFSIPACALFKLVGGLNPVVLCLISRLLQSSGVFGVAEHKVLKINVWLENILVP